MNLEKFIGKISLNHKKLRSHNTGFDEHATLSGRHVTKPKRYGTFKIHIVKV